MGNFGKLSYVAITAIILVTGLSGCTAPGPATASPSAPPAAAAPSPSTPTPPTTPALPRPAAIPTPSPSPANAPSSTPAATTAQIQWLGQSAFVITSSKGTRLLIDPFSTSTGYTIPALDGVDAVLITHEHGDHNNVVMATGNPLVIRGLTATGWNTVDQTVKDARVFSISPAVPVYHDSQQGAQRNRNSIFVIEVDGLRIAHLGDLGHVLDAAALNALGKLDVVLVPVGGVFTLDAPGATQVIGQLGSRIAVPMHYKTPRMQANWPGAGVEPFLAGKRVERPGSATLKLSRASLPSETTVVLLNYE